MGDFAGQRTILSQREAMIRSGPILLLLVPAAALAAPLPFEGRWTDDLKLCSVTEGDDAPFVLSRESIDTPASRCDIRRLSQHGMRYRLEVQCSEEGDQGRTRKTVALTVRGNRLTMRSDTTWELRRCP